MEGRFTWLIVITILVFGCSSSKPSKYETIAYKSASPEDKLRIEQEKIVVGMSVEACKTACPGCQFVRKFTSTKGDYELWEVTGQGKDLFLHVEKGKVEKISENKPKPAIDKTHETKDDFFGKKTPRTH